MWQSLKGLVVAGGWVLLVGLVVVLCTILLLAFAYSSSSSFDPSTRRTSDGESRLESASTGSGAQGGSNAAGDAPPGGEGDAAPVDPSRPLHEDLTLVESAIGEIGAALANDPDNESLKGLLVSAYRNQMMLIKKSLRLAADDAEQVGD